MQSNSSMTKTNIPNASFFLVFLSLCATAAESHWQKPVGPKPAGPLCASQIMLVTHACSFLMLNPLTPSPIPHPHRPWLFTPPTSPDLRSHERRHHRHGGRGGGRLRRHHHSPEEEICCRWLKEVDDQCVCDMLVALPPFLSRPMHKYTVMVGESCFQTFKCGTPIGITH